MGRPKRAKHPIAEEYGEWLATWASARTAGARRQMAGQVLEALGVDGMTTAELQSWLGGYSGWTKSTYTTHLASLTEWMVTAGYLTEDPMLDVKRSRRPNPAPRPLTPAEVDRAFDAADQTERDWMTLALQAGLRVHEIAKVRGQDMGESHVYVEGKGGKREMVPTHPDILEMREHYPDLGYWWPGRAPGSSITPAQITLRVGRAYRRAGIAEGSIHRMRHTYGTTLLENDVDLRRVQKLMRHSSLATTETYLHVADHRLTDAIGTLPSVRRPRDGAA